MAKLTNLASSFVRSISFELASFEKDYSSSLEQQKSLSTLKFQLKDVEQIWEKIVRKYDGILESPLLDEPEQAATIKLDEIQKQFVSAKKFYRLSTISIVEAIEAIEQVNRRTQVEAKAATTQISCFSVPPCDIEAFDGDYASWASFRDLFKAVYGNNSRLSGVEKLFYLKQKTRGEAKELVNTAPLTNDGFLIAWGNLAAQYENVRMQVNAQIKTLLNLPHVNDPCGIAIRKLQRTINGCIHNLKNLDIDTDQWDPILVHLCSSKLPTDILTKFEETLSDPSVVPAWIEMDAFLTNTYRGLESVADIKSPLGKPKQIVEVNQEERKGKSFHANVVPKDKHHSSIPKQNKQTDNRPDGSICKYCEERHVIRECPSFLTLGVNERIKFIEKNGCCYNCLAISHTVRDCKSSFSCRHCGKRHNTILHRPVSNSNVVLENEQPSSSRANPAQTFSTLTQSKKHFDDRKNLLGTAVFKIEVHGSLFSARALIDPASDFSFVSDSLRRKLHLPTTPIIAEISGLNEVISARSDKLCEVLLRSNTARNFSIKLQAIVVKTLTRTLPTQSITPPLTTELDDLQLADPKYYESRPIDFIIGSDYYPQILRDGVKRNILQSLIAQDTEFGWILTGPVDERHVTRSVVSYFNAVSLDKCITRFWEIEEIPRKPLKSFEDKVCEQIFKQTTTKLPTGRYQVSLPFRTPPVELGNSRHVAMAQFLRNEKNLMRKPELKAEYDNALQEYVDLKHMTPVAFNPHTASKDYYYLPHHAVVKPDRITTKVRVVFNASSKTSSGNSLNDALYVGPTLQQDLVVLILKWRLFKVVFNADVQKMYRQILMNPEHIAYQRILHRSNVNEPIKDYSLNTVTFGINSAPYLAIRCLHQLAEEIKHTYPLASYIIRNSMYVDDVLAGAHSIEEALQAQNQLIQALESVGFPLRKWTSNAKELLSHLSKDHLLDADLLTLPELNVAKTLGIRWNAKDDIFFFDVPLIERKLMHTKRSTLSDIARLFDPAGWLAPVVIVAKIIMQQIWQDSTHWDESLQPFTLHRWQCFLKGYEYINQIKIPRWIKFQTSARLEFHGFSDASEKAYSAVLYARVLPTNGPISVTLFCAKTRVAPLKVISLPKLELCGAVLLANMVTNTLSQLNLPDYASYFWTDSSIVLAWFNKPPTSWNTFVANRVSTVIDTIGVDNWNHVSSHDNPADVASRGCDPMQLRSDSLWWNGPSWLTRDKSTWPSTQPFTTQLEAKPVQIFANTGTAQTDILDRFSKWSRALRVLAYVFRFYHRLSIQHRTHIQHSTLEIDAGEIKAVRTTLTVLCQIQHFGEEYECLKKKTRLPNKSILLTLNPFLDSKGIIRANGRLTNSNQLTYEERHPAIISYNSNFARLLTQHVHHITLHGGNQVMLRVIRSCYWIPKVKNMIKSIIHACVPCTRYRNHQASQLMAALPPERTQISRPFTHVGVDFAGPLDIKTYTGRYCKVTKGYVCVFVCFSTKAIHLEASSELTTQAFMAAFARFFSRRGCPSAMHSDNGTNFVGANQMLRTERRKFVSTLKSSVLSTQSFQNLEWHFIPPGAPHMGGLWEAGVKSFKSHFKKITRSQKYTFEELITLLARIESCLNSRPLSPSSDNPEDLNPLTPGHFLIGAPLLTPAEPDISNDDANLPNRWQRLRIHHQILCRRWKDEYLKELHKRYKWKFPQISVEVDNLVVIKQDNLPPNEWSLGRVIKVYKGSDQRTRVVDLKTPSGILSRPITKLVVLPTN